MHRCFSQSDKPAKSGAMRINFLRVGYFWIRMSLEKLRRKSGKKSATKCILAAALRVVKSWSEFVYRSTAAGKLYETRMTAVVARQLAKVYGVGGKPNEETREAALLHKSPYRLI